MTEMLVRAQEVAHELAGTCRDLAEAASQDEQDNLVFSAALDDLIFLCDRCGWWCWLEELVNPDDDQICTECNSE